MFLTSDNALGRNARNGSNGYFPSSFLLYTITLCMPYYLPKKDLSREYTVTYSYHRYQMNTIGNLTHINLSVTVTDVTHRDPLHKRNTSHSSYVHSITLCYYATQTSVTKKQRSVTNALCIVTLIYAPTPFLTPTIHAPHNFSTRQAPSLIYIFLGDSVQKLQCA